MHEPERQAAYLRQVLAQARRPIALLIGAGCPVAVRVSVNGEDRPLIPDVAGLTAHVGETMAASELSEPYQTVIDQLPEDANIERVLSHVRALAQVAAPEEPVRGLTADDLRALDDRICSTIAAAVRKDLPSTASPYHRLAAWAGGSDRLHPVELFTPNYDLLLEHALEDVRVPYFDGFVGTQNAFFDTRAIEEDELPARRVRLWKIHGSVSWAINESGLIIRRATSVDTPTQVIYPSHLKYDESRRMPYLAMIDRLRVFLRRPASVLVTCGFSFRDEHLNEVLVQGLQGNASSTVFGLLHGDLSSYPAGVDLAEARPNLTLLARDGAVIGSRKGAWQQVESVPVNSDSAAVSWRRESEDVPFKPVFLLGDFAQFAELAAILTGVSTPEVAEEPAEANAS